MLSKALIVCLLALLCLQLTLAEPRLNTRIAGAFTATQGQFPYIVYLQYNYTVGGVITSAQGTGIIYSSSSVITTANFFVNLPAAGAIVTIFANTVDLNLPQQIIQFNASVGIYTVGGNGPIPTNGVIFPSQFIAGSSSYDIAIVRIPPPAVFNFTSGASIANFPTSAPEFGETLYAAAFGNQNPSGPTFPKLKFTKMNTKRNKLCAANLTANGVSRPFNFTYNFCIQSSVNTTLEGVCSRDIGGAVSRTADITNPNTYYEVVGLISYANDSTTCNAANPVPVIVSYLSPYQAGFFTPILGSLATVGNKQNATSNPRPNNGNFICGNGIVEGTETCDPAPGAKADCCVTSLCSFKAVDTLCGVDAGGNTTAQTCITKFRCRTDGTCAQNNRDGRNCGKKSTCKGGVCLKASSV